MNKQNSPSPVAKTKLGSMGQDLAPQAHSESVSLNASPASQTPPMQRPVEPQEGQHKVGPSLPCQRPWDIPNPTHCHLPAASPIGCP